MSNVIDIKTLIIANRALIDAKRQKAALEAELLSQGDKVHDGENYKAIVKDGRITLIAKKKKKAPVEDIIA